MNNNRFKVDPIGLLLGGTIALLFVFMFYLFFGFIHSELTAKRYTETIRGRVINKNYSLAYGEMGGSVYALLSEVIIETQGDTLRIPIVTGNEMVNYSVHKGDSVEFWFQYKDPMDIWSPFGRIKEYMERNGKSLCDWGWRLLAD